MKLVFGILPFAFGRSVEHCSGIVMNDTPCYSDECAQSRIGDFFECVGAQPPVDTVRQDRPDSTILPPTIFPDHIKECFRHFAESVANCGPTAEKHPFCDEDNPNYNAIACAMVLNKCLLEELDDIFD